MKEKKDLLRKAALAARNALDKQSALTKSHMAANRVVVQPAFILAKTILAYHAFSGELDVTLICETAAALGKRVAFPVCKENGILIASLPLNGKTGKNRYGIDEPIASQIIEPGELDLVIVPCVAFDMKLMRIGWGKGYYDRYLPQCVNAVYIGAAFEEQRVEDIPAEPWDRPMHAVITDAGVYAGKSS